MSRVNSNKWIVMIPLFMPLWAWSHGPCMPIAMACMEQGYTDKQSMIKQCVLPIIRGQKTLPNVQFSDNQIQQCKMVIIDKMKANKSQAAKI